MGTRQETIALLVDQLSRAGTITAKKMFGEYGLYCDGTLVALVCDDELFIKPTSAGEEFAPDAPRRPPYDGAKPSIAITADRCDNHDWLIQLIHAELIANPADRRSRRIPQIAITKLSS